MNKEEKVKIEGALGTEALRILREIPGLAVVQRAVAHGRKVDAFVRCSGQRTPIAVEFKGRANAATAWHLVHQAGRHPDTPLLLVAGQTTVRAREILGENGIALVDGQGNAHIELPGLLFHLEGRRRPREGRAMSPPRLRGKAGIVVQALLLHPERAYQIAELAAEARVSAGLVHRVLTRLEREKLVAAEGTGPRRVRRVTNPTALLDLWAEEHVDRPIRTLAHLLTQTTQQLAQELGSNLGRHRIEYAFTGAAAGSLVAPFMTAVPVFEVWAQATAAPEQLCEATGAEPVTEGHNVVFLQAKDDAPLAFREQVNGLWTVNRFRLYTELRHDPRRGREQADHLRREMIGF